MEQAIQTVFEQANVIGRRTGFVQRVSTNKFDGKRFAATLALGHMQPGEVSLSGLAQFASHLGVQVSAQGVDERYGQLAAKFLYEVLQVAMSQVVASDPVALPLLERFAGIVVEDSSTFSLPDELQTIWKGCGGNQSGTQSAFKWHVRWELLRGALVGQQLQDGYLPDTRSPLREQQIGKKSIHLVDLGYFDCGQFRREQEQGSYLFTRFKAGSTLAVFDAEGQPLDVLDWAREHASTQQAECWVQVSATHRFPARLIAVPVPEEVAIKRQGQARRRAQKHSRPVSAQVLALCHWTLLLTTIPPDLLSVREALILLRLRWQIELLFKLFKHEGQVACSRSRKPWHQLCDLYAKLLGMLIVHWHVIVGCWQIPDRSMVKASRAIRSQLVLVAKALGGKLDLHWVICDLLEGLSGCRMGKRQKHPSSFQLLMTCSSNQIDAFSIASGGADCFT
jgi:hypothetical protein